MGKSRAVLYVANVYDQTGCHTHTWEHKRKNPYLGRGTPNDAKAEDYRKELNRSLAFGGCNYPVSQAAGVVLHVRKVEVVHCPTGRIVARAAAPMFEAV